MLFTSVLTGVEDLKGRKERVGIEPGEDRAEVRKALSEAWGRYLREAERLCG